MNSQSGITLVEIAISVAIIGILMGGALELQQRARAQRQFESTYDNMDAVIQALSIYVETTGRLPCPADPAVTDASFYVDAGELVCLIGANGAGKSSLLKALTGMVHVSHGTTKFQGDTITHLARSIYDEHRLADLFILADALEEAGCVESSIIAHCRQSGPHLRGCWVVDLILGKE